MSATKPLKSRASLKKVTLSLPFSLGTAEWSGDESERAAAWALYVELATRVSTQPLGPKEGLLREALSSLYALFPTTRDILKAAGPNVGLREASVGRLAIEVLNQGLRPFLARWHPELASWESTRQIGASPKEHEDSWLLAPQLRSELATLRSQLSQYADTLRAMIGMKGAGPAPPTGGAA